MKVTRSKAAATSDIVIDDDLDFLTTYQVKRLAAPASGEALRKGNKDIANAEVADAAAIAATKIANTAITRTIFGARGDLLYRGATVPQKLVKGTAGHFLKQGSDDPEWAALTSPLTVSKTEAYSAAAPSSWTDLDLSSIIGAQATLVLLGVTSPADKMIAFRLNGDGDEFYALLDGVGIGVALADLQQDIHHAFIVATDAAGIIEWRLEDTTAVVIDVIAWIK